MRTINVLARTAERAVHNVDPLSSLGQLRAPLEALGDLLSAAGEEAHLVVVGGVAILVRGVSTRVTTDVDVIARGEATKGGDLQLVPPDPLPAAVRSGVARVARDFGLPPDWLNTVDTDPRSVHMQDLLALAPTDSELSEAAGWVSAQDASSAFAGMLEQAIS